MTCKNEYNSRCGFTDVDKDWSRAKSIRLANRARKERLENPTGKERMSQYLQSCMIPQVTGNFIEYSSKEETKACALGALHVGADGSVIDEKVNWYGLTNHFDVNSLELDRFVRCPEENKYLKNHRCRTNASVAEIIYHLNDVHDMSNFEIGTWLESYDL